MTVGSPASTNGPTPETVLAHELVGLRVRVVEATNEDLVGIAGRVVEETTNTLRIEGPGDDQAANGDADAGTRVRTVPKTGATFEFALPAEGKRTGGSRSTSGRGSDGEFAVVDGRRLVARPARRTQEKTGGKTWHSA